MYDLLTDLLFLRKIFHPESMTAPCLRHAILMLSGLSQLFPDLTAGKSKKPVAKTGITIILAVQFTHPGDRSPETKSMISDRWTTAGFQ
jgi:hypothetical protein